MMTTRGFVEVLGDDGELRPILIEDASDEVIEDGLAILERRADELARDIKQLRELLRRRRGEPPSAEAVREHGPTI